MVENSKRKTGGTFFAVLYFSKKLQLYEAWMIVGSNKVSLLSKRSFIMPVSPNNDPHIQVRRGISRKDPPLINCNFQSSKRNWDERLGEPLTLLLFRNFSLRPPKSLDSRGPKCTFIYVPYKGNKLQKFWRGNYLMRHACTWGGGSKKSYIIFLLCFELQIAVKIQNLRGAFFKRCISYLAEKRRGNWC